MTAAQWPNAGLEWPIAWAGVALIAEREGCRLVAYRCPAGIWTCGWGETEGVTSRTRWTQDYADQRFRDSLAERAAAVLAMCQRDPTDHQLAALVSLAYNIGNEALRRSSVLRAHNRGDHQAAARAFALWNKARVGGQLQPLAGLTARRAAEAALYLSPDPSAPPEPMPQAVAPESTIAASPIAASGAVTASAGAVALVSEAQQQIQPIGDLLRGLRAISVDVLGLPPSTGLAAVLLLAGGAVVWWRWQQRRQGWA
jgi:lysozyme